MYSKMNIINLTVAVLLSVELVSSTTFTNRDLPISANDKDATGNVEDASSTPYSDYASYANAADQKYPNGTEKSMTPTAPPKKVDASGDYSALYPPPPALSLPPFSGIPYPLPLTGTKKHCAPRQHDDGMTVALPSDLYTGRVSKCGQKVVVVFEPVAGQPWSGPKNNLTLTVIDAFDNDDKTEIGRTVLLSEKAWKEATGNSIINKFESWPIRWFFLDAAMQQDTAEGTHENSDGEEDSAGNSTSSSYSSPSDNNSTTTSNVGPSNNQNSTTSSNSPSSTSDSKHPKPEKDFTPVPDSSSSPSSSSPSSSSQPTPNNKRNLLSRRFSKPPSSGPLFG